jgi:hypothetical protein
VLGGLGLDLGCHLAAVAPLDRRLGMDFRAPHFHRLEAVCTTTSILRCKCGRIHANSRQPESGRSGWHFRLSTT